MFFVNVRIQKMDGDSTFTLRWLKYEIIGSAVELISLLTNISEGFKIEIIFVWYRYS